MTWHEELVWCDGCGVEIVGAPVVVDKRNYCCQDCAQGIRCDCGERMELDDERNNTGEPSRTLTGYMS
jgi:hypothetical protein